MTAKEMLIDALGYYDIGIVSSNSNTVVVIKNYVVEVEASGLYKLLQDQQVIAPFDDLDELCLFILRD